MQKRIEQKKHKYIVKNVQNSCNFTINRVFFMQCNKMPAGAAALYQTLREDARILRSILLKGTRKKGDISLSRGSTHNEDWLCVSASALCCKLDQRCKMP